MTVSEALQKMAGASKRLTCKEAFAVATGLDVSPTAVGAAADELGIHITECQLGLFGYGRAHHPNDKRLRPRESYPEALLKHLQALDGRDLPCAFAWDIADDTDVDKLTVGSAAEHMGIHLSVCQLGCF